MWLISKRWSKNFSSFGGSTSDIFNFATIILLCINNIVTATLCKLWLLSLIAMCLVTQHHIQNAFNHAHIHYYLIPCYTLLMYHSIFILGTFSVWTNGIHTVTNLIINYPCQDYYPYHNCLKKSRNKQSNYASNQDFTSHNYNITKPRLVWFKEWSSMLGSYELVLLVITVDIHVCVALWLAYKSMGRESEREKEREKVMQISNRLNTHIAQ